MQLPLINCDPSYSSDRTIATEIDRALSTTGFMAVTGLGLSSQVIADAFAVSQRFFSLPIDDKQRCAYSAASENFGYQGLGQEALNPQAPGDLKESFTMRNLLAKDIAANRWPDPAFCEVMQRFYSEAMVAAARLQRLLAQALDVPDDFFIGCHSGENVTLRLLHYPATAAESVAAAQMGAGAHTDYGMLTLLIQDAVGGLQVRLADGTWQDIAPRPETLVINAGDLLERWSNGRFRSTWHRVLPPATGANRYSIALFVDPDSATRVAALASCVGPDNPARYEPTTAGAHLQAKIEATHRA